MNSDQFSDKKPSKTFENTPVKKGELKQKIEKKSLFTIQLPIHPRYPPQYIYRRWVDGQDKLSNRVL